MKRSIPLLKMHAIIVVRKGNPKQIKGLERPARATACRTVLAGEAAAVNALVHRELEKKGGVETARRSTGYLVGSVSEAASAATLWADASIICNSMLPQYPTLEAVEDPLVAAALAHVSVSVLKSTTHPDAAATLRTLYCSARPGLMCLCREWIRDWSGEKLIMN